MNKKGKIVKKLLALSFGLLILSVSGIASAGQESGLYLGGAIGSAGLDFSVGTVGFDDDDFGYKIFGGYNFGIIPLIDLGVEGSYVDFGEASNAQIFDYNIGVTGWDLFGVGAVNLGPIGLFGKVGQVWWKSDSNILQAVLDKSGNDMAYGIGLRFQLGSIAIRGEYEIFDIDVVDIGYASLGASWTF